MYANPMTKSPMKKGLPLLVAALLLAACVGSDGGLGLTEASTAGPDEASAELSVHAHGRHIVILDNCDPQTFNGCENRTGGMSFQTFIGQLQKHGRVQGWRFAPSVIHVTRSMTLPVVNRGGVIHDFTEVAEFGGGYSEGLNQLSGNLLPAPECVVDPNASPLVRNPDVNVLASGEQGEATFEPGQARKYQCCLHPWMRAVSK